MDGDEVMLITKNGVINRQRIEELRVIGRNTQGVKLMNLDKGDLVVDVARVIIEDSDERTDEENGDDGQVAEAGTQPGEIESE
jgi:DNA gyrase subunit A